MLSMWWALDILEPVPELFEDPVGGWLDQGQPADAIRVFDRELERGLASA